VSIHGTGLGDDEPLVVSPKRAEVLLNIGHTTLYELLAAGELESYREGKGRKITMASIRARIARKLAEDKGDFPKAARLWDDAARARP
jgi:excisionase family DNA binding protein